MQRAKQRFDNGIRRVQRLGALYNHLLNQLHFPHDEISDILRSQIVYAVSSFDKFIHDIVKQGMVETFMGLRSATNAYSSFGINLQQLSSIRNSTTIPPPEVIFENIIINNHKHLSFQEPEKVANALSLIWQEDHKWHKVAACIGRTELNVKTELKNIVIRRNQIVHEADIDIMTGLEQNIILADVQASVLFIQALGNCIYTLVI